MYVVAFTAQGFGNKMFFLIGYIYEFKKLKKQYKDLNKLYIATSVSRHEKDIDKEKIQNIFPRLKELEWLEFISWEKYDELKTNAFRELVPEYIYKNEPFLDMKNFIKKEMKIDSKYDYLLDKYDTKNGIAVHIRLGDKFEINYENLKKHNRQLFVLMKPEYYVNNVLNMLKEKEGPVYIFSDSNDFAECLIKPYLPNAKIVEEDFVETFYLLTKFKRAIISESTLSISAFYMNFKNPQVIISAYRIDFDPKGKSTYKLVKNPYIDDETFILEKSKDYIMTTKKDYDDVIKDCR